MAGGFRARHSADDTRHSADDTRHSADEVGRERRAAGDPPAERLAHLVHGGREFADGFFPLKISTGNAGEVTMEVTEITRKKLDASMFQPPAGYTEMRIGG